MRNRKSVKELLSGDVLIRTRVELLQDCLLLLLEVKVCHEVLLGLARELRLEVFVFGALQEDLLKARQDVRRIESLTKRAVIQAKAFNGFDHVFSPNFNVLRIPLDIRKEVGAIRFGDNGNHE